MNYTASCWWVGVKEEKKMLGKKCKNNRNQAAQFEPKYWSYWVFFSSLLKDLHPVWSVLSVWCSWLRASLAEDDSSTTEAIEWGLFRTSAVLGVFFSSCTRTQARQALSLGASVSFRGCFPPLQNFLAGYCYSPVNFRNLQLWCMIQFCQTSYRPLIMAINHGLWFGNCCLGIQRFFTLSRREAGDGNSYWAVEVSVLEGLFNLVRCTHLTANMPDFWSLG